MHKGTWPCSNKNMHSNCIQKRTMISIRNQGTRNVNRMLKPSFKPACIKIMFVTKCNSKWSIVLHKCSICFLWPVTNLMFTLSAPWHKTHWQIRELTKMQLIPFNKKETRDPPKGMSPETRGKLRVMLSEVLLNYELQYNWIGQV